MKPHKVFCVGFHKTGTSSVGVALDKLGYRTIGYAPFRQLAHQQTLTLAEVEAKALEVAAQADALKDSPWPILYRQMDAAFPGSKFIHIVRDPDRWINSAVNDFGEVPNSMRRLVYGTPYPKGNEAAWLERYHQHNADVRAYFADRPDDFISLDLEKGEVNWKNICTFLDEPVRDEPWPHANRREVKRWKMLWLRVRQRLGLVA